VPLALALLIARRHAFSAAVLSNGFMFDTDGLVAAAAHTYRFANPIAGRSARDLPRDVPLFLVRSGADEFAGVNASIDAFLPEAMRYNLPLTLVNHAAARHGYEINDDSGLSRYVLEQAVGFLRFHLLRGDAEVAER
jgi:hypothetical protein